MRERRDFLKGLLGMALCPSCEHAASQTRDGKTLIVGDDHDNTSVTCLCPGLANLDRVRGTKVRTKE